MYVKLLLVGTYSPVDFHQVLLSFVYEYMGTVWLLEKQPGPTKCVFFSDYPPPPLLQNASGLMNSHKFSNLNLTIQVTDGCKYKDLEQV